MAWEQTKAAKRRYNIGAFHNRYFVGTGIDIGGKPDPLGQYINIFPKMDSVRIWDIEDGDAQYLKGVPDNNYDFLHSSHCLEHMVDVYEALQNWIRVVKPNGYLIITVPDEDLYEMGIWPSQYNPDHKWTFTICKETSWSPRSINIIDLARDLSSKVEVEKIELQRDFFREILLKQKFDQTLTPVTECSIEFIFRKRV
jgi:ubiquinone/menaquinone biosynthesis C-methylase UbiE